jgi:hypothetical protein
MLELEHVDRHIHESISVRTSFVSAQEADVSLPSSSNSSPNGIAMPSIAGDNVDQVASPDDYPTWACSDLYWDLDNDTNAEYEYPILLPSPPPITDRENEPSGEGQSSHSSESDGSPLWALGTSALLFGLIDFGADKLDIWMEEDIKQDGGDDHKNSSIIQPPDGYRPDVEEDIYDDLDTYHPILVTFLSKMGDVDIALERSKQLDEEKTELQREKETRQRFGLDLDPNDEAWLLECDAIQHELDEKRNVYEAQAAALKHECLLHGLIDDEGKPLPAALGWETEDIPTPNLTDLEKPLSQSMLILTSPKY